MTTVTLRLIDDANRDAVTALRVTEVQDEYVGGVAASLAEAADTPEACPWFRAIYAGDVPVGFVMISDNIPEGHPDLVGPYFLWRLLIDARFQGRGYGSAALDRVADYLRTRPGADTLLTSFHPGPDSPEGFYLRYGFIPTGDVHEGEPVLALTLPE